MHPAYSVILFTTASGAGYGLLFWLGLLHGTGQLPAGGTLWAALSLGLALVTLGLLSSTVHLGHPERAHRALSQWRSSWLSREGVVAVATYGPAGLWWAALTMGWGAPLLGLLTALGAVATVYCTGMIYAALRTVRRWHSPLVPAIYLALAAGTGGLLGALCLALGNVPGAGGVAGAAALSLALAWALKEIYWRRADADPGRYTAEMATGLGGLGTVRPLDPPHTRPNFVMREMGYAVGRKHAEKLRLAVRGSLFAVPILLALLGGAVALAAAVLFASLGVVVERWLFFAEAEHVSQLYYGAAQA